MAKTHGQVNENTGRIETRKVKTAREVSFPWTPGPQTKWEQFKRAAVG